MTYYDTEPQAANPAVADPFVKRDKVPRTPRASLQHDLDKAGTNKKSTRSLSKSGNDTLHRTREEDSDEDALSSSPTQRSPIHIPDVSILLYQMPLFAKRDMYMKLDLMATPPSSTSPTSDMKSESPIFHSPSRIDSPTKVEAATLEKVQDVPPLIATPTRPVTAPVVSAQPGKKIFLLRKKSAGHIQAPMLADVSVPPRNKSKCVIS